MMPTTTHKPKYPPPPIRYGKLPRWFYPRIRRSLKDGRFKPDKRLPPNCTIHAIVEAIRDEFGLAWDHWGQCTVRHDVLVVEPLIDHPWLGWEVLALSEVLGLEYRMMAQRCRKCETAVRVEFRPPGSGPMPFDDGPGCDWLPPGTDVLASLMPIWYTDPDAVHCPPVYLDPEPVAKLVLWTVEED
jgi:hypothetical protein